MIVRLRRVRQIIDEAHRNAVSYYVHVGRKLRARGVHHPLVRPSRIHRTQARLRVIGLNVLFQLDTRASHVPGFQRDLAAKLTLNGEAPLQRVTGALVDVDAGLLNLRWPDYGRSKDIEPAELGNEVVAGKRLRQIVRQPGREAEQRIEIRSRVVDAARLATRSWDLPTRRCRRAGRSCCSRCGRSPWACRPVRR